MGAVGWPTKTSGGSSNSNGGGDGNCSRHPDAHR